MAIKNHSLAILLIFFLAALLLPRAGAQPESYLRFRLIEVASQSLADSLIARYHQGESFRKLARQHSLHPSARDGGEIDWTGLSRVPEFAEALKTLPDGGISGVFPLGKTFFILQKVKELSAPEYRQWQAQKAQLDSLIARINAEIELQNFAGAESLIRQAETLLPGVDEESSQFTLLDQKGGLLLRQGKFAGALQVYRELASRSAKMAHQAGQQSAFMGIGRAYQGLGEYASAIVRYDSALALAREAGDRSSEGISLGSAGECYEAMGLPERALAAYNAAREIARETGERYLEGNWLGRLGQTYQNSGNYALAAAQYESALAIARETGDRFSEHVRLEGLGQAYSALGRHEPALACFTEALAIAREVGDRYHEGVALGNTGQAYQNLGNHGKAIAYFDSALTIAQQIGDRYHEGVWQGSAGQAHKARGNYPRAIAHYESALAIARELGDHYHEGVWLGSLGQAQESLGNIAAAVACYDSALALARQTGDRRGAGLRLGNLGQIQFALGNYPSAIEYYQHSLMIARQIGDRMNEGVRLGSIGQARDALGDYETAIAYYDSALTIARSIGDRQNEGVWLGSAGQAYKNLENYPRAIDYFEKALEIARDIGDKESIWRHYWNLANARAKDPQYPAREVIDLFENGLNALEDITVELVKDLHKQSYLENKQGLYDDYVSYLMQLPEPHYHERALEVSEASRTRALKDLLQGQRVQAPLSVEKRLEAQKRSEELAQSPPTAPQPGMPAASAAAFTSVEDWAAHIAIPPDTLGSSEGAPELRLREIRAEAAHHTLLMYHVLPDGIAMWAITPDGKIYAHKQQGITADSLLALVRSARQAMGLRVDDLRGARPVGAREPATSPYGRILRSLDSLLIEPLAAQLPVDTTREIAIIPHEVLFLLPFACLLDREGRYLVQRHSFTTSPSVGLLKFARGRIREQQFREAPRLLLMGNPIMPNPALWIPLPGAEREVLKIAEHVNQKKGTGFQEAGARALQALPLTRDSATEEEFRRIAGIQNYIHLSTHGYMVSNPLRCGVVLAQTGNSMETDGILTTGEVFGMPLNAELVVLSACETGLGRISSDGVAGLSRAFLYAGAASLMVSLWPVPDEATQELMVKFYEELARDGNKARALRAAQIFTLERHPHPRDWAAFVLIGQGR